MRAVPVVNEDDELMTIHDFDTEFEEVKGEEE